MSGGKFAARFLRESRAKGHSLGPLFSGVLQSMAEGQKVDSHVPERPTAPLPACRTVQEILKEKQRKGPAAPSAPADKYAEFMPPLVKAEREYRFNVSATLTACLDTVECPKLARRLFRLLHELALISVRARGLPSAGLTVGVFHLPLELLAAHFQVDRTTIYRNIQPLLRAGVLHCRDHYGKLRHQTAVTGKVWAISIHPERQLAGTAEPVRVTRADLKYDWRNLDADAEVGRTVWNLTRSEEQKAAYKAQREAKAEQRAEARARADLRAAERQAAKERGEKVATGRKAATENAKKTRAENPRPTRQKSEMQQSPYSLKAVEKQELIRWVLAGFTTSTDVTLTVATAISHGLDVIFTLPSLAGLPRQRRNLEVERTAHALAAQFDDTANIRFWCWLVWQLIRADDQGQPYADDVAHLLARVWHDIKHDESMHCRSQKNPAALVVAELKACGIYDALKLLAPTRAGGRPSVKA